MVYIACALIVLISFVQQYGRARAQEKWSTSVFLKTLAAAALVVACVIVPFWLLPMAKIQQHPALLFTLFFGAVIVGVGALAVYSIRLNARAEQRRKEARRHSR